MIRDREPRLSKVARKFRVLVNDASAVTIIEFALTAPVFLILLVEIFDLGQMVYGKSLLQGAVEKAARDSTLETTSTLQADTTVKNIILPVLPGANVSTERSSYFDFTDINRAEKWNDANSNSTCDNSESFVDENGNDQWDSDIGVSGNGGASDVVVYTVTVSYDPIFKIPFMPQSWNTRTLTAKAVRKNQPYASQDTYGSSTGTCS